MIDIHSHILPGIDDGAKDKNEAYLMIEQLKNNKITTVVCTPHFNPSTKSLEKFIEERDRAYSEIMDKDINLLLGSEVFFSEILFYYEDISSLCIKDTIYLLIEFPTDIKINQKFFKQVKELMAKYEVIPIIAHIERYKNLKNKKLLLKLKNLGCILQVNTSSLLDKSKSKKLLKLIKEDFVDVLGSDCHNTSSRPPIFLKAMDMIAEQLGYEYRDKLVDYGYSIVNNKDIRKIIKFKI